MAAFPAGLPEPLLSSYQVEPQSTNIRTDMEAGPARMRRRFTAAVTNAPFGLALSEAQMVTFKSFYETDIEQGSSWFTITLDFGDGNATHECRFTQPYVARPMGVGNWLVSLSLEARS